MVSCSPVTDNLTILIHPLLFPAWTILLHDTIYASSVAPPWHISLLAVEHETAWVVIPPEDDANFQTMATSASRSPPRASSGVILAEAGSRTYMLSPPTSLVCVPASGTPCISTQGLGAADKPFIPDSEDEESPLQQQPNLRARARSTLIHESLGCGHTTVSMINIYLLHSVRSCRIFAGITVNDPATMGQRTSAVKLSDEQIVHQVARSFHALAELTRLRWRLNDVPGLPLHLGAVEVMNMTLARDSSADSF